MHFKLVIVPQPRPAIVLSRNLAASSNSLVLSNWDEVSLVGQSYGCEQRKMRFKAIIFSPPSATVNDPEPKWHYSTKSANSSGPN
jgi:hypothetical protein